MPISAQEKKRSIQEKRSRAIQQKINLLWSRDGNDSPQIDSAEDDDNFNLAQLFGGSMSSLIDWTQLGVEGLIRCYYEIVYKINGKKRNNLIINNDEIPNGGAYSSNSYDRSDLTTTAKQVLIGTAYSSGFFVGNAAGFEGKSESNTTIKQKAARGEYDLLSSTFSHNRDKVNIGGVWTYPPNDSGLLLDQFDQVINIIGDESPLGPHTGTFSYGTNPPPYNSFISDSILGKRFCDILPYSYNSPSRSTFEGSTTYINGTYSYGNGSYDFDDNISESQDRYGGSVWDSGTAVTTSTPSIFDEFGTSVKIYDNLVVISSKKNNKGAIYIYQLNNGILENEQILIPTELNIGDEFGSCIAMTNNIIVAGAPKNKTEFITTWQTDATGTTTSGTNQIKLPLNSTGTYNFTVDWGDGSIDTITSYNQTEVTHTYAVAGSYDITIDGQCEGWGFSLNGEDNSKLTGIKQWGDVKLHNSGSQFRDCNISSYTTIDELNTSNITDMTAMFHDAILPSNFDISEWDTSNVIDMDQMFYRATLPDTFDLGGWCVTNITTEPYRFGTFNGTTQLQPVWGTCPNLAKDYSNKVYVYEYDGVDWSNYNILTIDEDDPNRLFGTDVSISNNIIVINGPGDDNRGAVYVYDNSEVDGWNNKTTLIASDSLVMRNFGKSVDIYEERMIISAENESTEEGAVYIFNYDGNDWLEEVKLESPDIENANSFGHKVIVRGDYIFVSAPGENNGKVYIFNYDGNDWSNYTTIVASDQSAQSNFGQSIDVFGSFIIVGSMEASYVFNNIGGNNWSTGVKLVSPNTGLNGSFGYDVSISGKYVIVGAPKENVSFQNDGATYVFYNNMDGIEWWDPRANPRRDSNALPSGYDYSYRDYYDTSLDTQLTTIKASLQDLWQFIEYTKIDYDNFFMNTTVIPGREENWYKQLNWQSTINNIITYIDDFLTTRPTSTRLTQDSLIRNLKYEIQNYKSILGTIADEIDSSFGNPLDQSTLYGLRLLWLKNLIDVMNGGSKITLHSIQNAIEDADKKIAQSEESYGIIGVTLKDDPTFSIQKYWDGGIVKPIIGGIETHLSLDTRQYLDNEETIENENYFEMIPDGLIVAWEETAHATAYTLYKSNDYDPITEQGTWEALIPSGQSYTNEQIDINTGKVLSYFIDYDVDFEAEENPYYRVQVFDVGQKSDRNYLWYGATSELSEPMSAQDFIATPSQGTNIPGMSGPPPARPDELPDYLFKYATMKMGGESSDSPINKSYTSDVEFDSLGSNLEVFVDGVMRNQGSSGGDYIILDSKNIQFNQPINSTSKITMIVYFGDTGGSGSWKSPVATLNQRPTLNNIDGDVILVLENNTLYSWDANEGQWYEIAGAGGSLTHTDLQDMPDTNGLNADHDSRYHRKEEVDTIFTQLQSQINSLSYLIPDDASPLSSTLRVTNTSYHTGYLSGGSFNNFLTLTPYQSFNKIIIGDLFHFESVNKDAEFGDADKGILNFYINNVLIDSINLDNLFNEEERNTQQSWTPYSSSTGTILINSIKPFNDFGQYQKADFKLVIDKNRLTPGENVIKLNHTIGENTRSTGDFVFFWDSNPTDINFSNEEIKERYIGSQKYLSGVKYYSLNDQLNIKFAAGALFDNTFLKGNQIEIDTDEFGVEKFNIDYTNQFTTSDGSSAVTPNYGITVWYDNYSTLNKSNIYSTGPILKLKGFKPARSEEKEYIVNNFLINTWNKASDDKSEYFLDEVYRLPYASYDTIPGNYTNQWNSKTALSSGQLMVFDGKLQYPTRNFMVGYHPQQNVNYSGMTGRREYMRAFVDDGTPHNNGSFIIKGSIFDDPQVKIMMKLPNLTQWLDLKKPYNEAEFTGSEGDGCLIEHVENTFNWTSGGYSTALSGYMIILRVIMEGVTTNSIEEILINW